MTMAASTATRADDFDLDEEEAPPPPPTILDFAEANIARLQELRERFIAMAERECPPPWTFGASHSPERCETWRNRILRVRTNDRRLALDAEPPAPLAVEDYPFTLAEARPVLLLAAVARIEVVRQIALYAAWLGCVDLGVLDLDIDRPEDVEDFFGRPRPAEGWPTPLPEKVIIRRGRLRLLRNRMVPRLPSPDEQFERSYRHRASFGRTRDVGWAGHRRPGPKAKAAKAKPVKPDAAQKEAARLQRDVERVLQVLARCRQAKGLPGSVVQRRAKMKRAAVFAVLAHLQSAGRVEADGATKKKRFRLVAATSGSVPGSAGDGDPKE